MQPDHTAADYRLEFLKQIWAEARVISASAHWTPMMGGRSNPIWHVSVGRGLEPVVCKLFTPNTATPLFANDGTREALALDALSGQDIAPQLIAFQETTIGECVVYRHMKGAPWRGEIEGIARLMARLHQQPLPTGLPDITVTTGSLIADAQGMAQDAEAVLPPVPVVDEPASAQRCFLHGDVVPGNILVHSDNVRLIDWQCPAIGDPSADIATFLSPAMQNVYGFRALSRCEIDGFLSAYSTAIGNDQTAARYRSLAPLFHWRMAAYCHWKVAQGDVAYAQGAALELEALKEC